MLENVDRKDTDDVEAEEDDKQQITNPNNGKNEVKDENLKENGEMFNETKEIDTKNTVVKDVKVDINNDENIIKEKEKTSSDQATATAKNDTTKNEKPTPNKEVIGIGAMKRKYEELLDKVGEESWCTKTVFTLIGILIIGVGFGLISLGFYLSMIICEKMLNLESDTSDARPSRAMNSFFVYVLQFLWVFLIGWIISVLILYINMHSGPADNTCKKVSYITAGLCFCIGFSLSLLLVPAYAVAQHTNTNVTRYIVTSFVRLAGKILFDIIKNIYLDCRKKKEDTVDNIFERIMLKLWDWTEPIVSGVFILITLENRGFMPKANVNMLPSSCIFSLFSSPMFIPLFTEVYPELYV